jgi:Zn finger protein HypA/HybF involved in hydrogenase expression
MICEKCGKEFTEDYRKDPVYRKTPMRFCSRFCANSKVFSLESRELKRQKNKGKINISPKNHIFSSEDRSLGGIKSGIIRKQSAINKALFILENGAKYEEANKVWRYIRNIIIEEKGKCEECGVLPIWQGKPLSFHVDHIDGDLDNNKKENFRVLCPNCDSQTEFFGSKNKGRGRRIRGFM